MILVFRCQFFVCTNKCINCNVLLYAMIVCRKMVQKLAGQDGHLPTLFLLDQARKSYDCQSKTSYSLCNFDKNSAKRGQYYVISDLKLTQLELGMYWNSVKLSQSCVIKSAP